MTPLTVGIIGAGRIGKIHAENILYKIQKAQLYKMVDPHVDSTWAEKHNVNLSNDDYKSLLNDDAIDAVIICSPSTHHTQHIIDAAAAGKHVFCEKPIALDPEKITAAINAAERAKVKLQVGFNRRFDPSFARLKEFINNNEIGKLRTLHITSRDPEPPSLEYVKASGGLFFDMAIHDFDMARFLVGSEVVAVSASGMVAVDPAIKKCGDIDTAVIILHFANNVMAVINNCRECAYGYDQRVEVFGSHGSAFAENNRCTNTILKTKQGRIKENPLYFFTERYQESYLQEMHAFVDSISNNTQTPVTGVDGLMPVYIGIAAKQSLEQERVIKLDDVISQFKAKEPADVAVVI